MVGYDIMVLLRPVRSDIHFFSCGALSVWRISFFWSAKTNVQHFKPKYYGQDVLYSFVMSWIWVQSLPQLLSLFRRCPSEEIEHLVKKFLIPPLKCLQLVLAFCPDHVT